MLNLLYARAGQDIRGELLERMGFTVEPAENGQIALDKVKCASPGDYDLVIMDLQMPVMDGWQATAEIRRLQIGRAHV